MQHDHLSYEPCLAFRAHRFEEHSVCHGCGWLEEEHVVEITLFEELLERQAS